MTARDDSGGVDREGSDEVNREDSGGTVVESDDGSDGDSAQEDGESAQKSSESTSERGEVIPRPRIAGESRTPATDSDVADERESAFVRPPIEPEEPAAENALFVVLGVIGTVLLFVSAVVPGVI
ncbi:DUF7312 domain-containing protein [Halobellus salinisoli]|uniref:DUF7312 domain-containing protein n=1 Tax=Halobellus salinisoli TaxID=3108500 RepID=UPI00300A914F